VHGRMFFRPLDDLFVRGLGAAAGRLINAAIFRARTIQWREQLDQSVDLFFVK
jgi:hypothetical protein